jgi:hypothetical protein
MELSHFILFLFLFVILSITISFGLTLYVLRRYQNRYLGLITIHMNTRMEIGFYRDGYFPEKQIMKMYGYYEGRLLSKLIRRFNDLLLLNKLKTRNIEFDYDDEEKLMIYKLVQLLDKGCYQYDHISQFNCIKFL